ncbi:MAG: hypothetical protein C5B53_00050 [Candidatus Melainabacteria bacterium]|nr:MAG: hypothetical protein C5B53_00050 [Candidatus Melainabacteria bacterium]
MSDMGQIVNSHTVRFERRFPGPIEKVWNYFATKEGLGEWLCPDATIDPRLGGRIELRFANSPCNTTCCIRGIISEFDPPRLIAFSWNDTKNDLTSTVRFELEQIGDEVRLILTHSRIAPDFMPKVAAGWHSHLEHLLAASRSEKPPEHEALYMALLKKYSAALTGIVVSAAISPAICSSTDLALKSLCDQRQQLLIQYDRTWKAADELEGQIDSLKHQLHADKKHTNANVEHTLKRTYDDLRRIEQDIRDLDKASVK